MAEEQVQQGSQETATLDSILDEVFDEMPDGVQVQGDDLADTADADAAFEEGADSEDGDDEIEAEAEEDDEAEDEDASPDKDTAPVTDYAEAIRIIEETNGKQIADLIRGRMSDWSRAQNEAKAATDEARAMQQELKATLAEIQESLGTQETEETAEEADDDLPAGITPAHIELFDKMLESRGKAWAEKNGWVKKDDVEAVIDTKASATAAATARVQTHQTAAREAIAAYGENFGKIEDGRFVLSATAKARMEPVLQRLGGKDFPGTLMDVFKAAYSPEELIAFKQKAKPVTPKDSGRVTKLRNANSVDTKANGVPTKPTIYTKGKDNFDQVFEKAFALSEREVGLRRR